MIHRVSSEIRELWFQWNVLRTYQTGDRKKRRRIIGAKEYETFQVLTTLKDSPAQGFLRTPLFRPFRFAIPVVSVLLVLMISASFALFSAHKLVSSVELKVNEAWNSVEGFIGQAGDRGEKIVLGIAKQFADINKRIGQARSDREKADLLTIRGSLEREKAFYREAQNSFQQARALYEKEHNHQGLGSVLVEWGILERIRGHHETAHQNFIQADREYGQSNDIEGQAYAHHAIGDLEFQQRNWDKAGQAYIFASQLYEKTHNNRGLGNTLLGLGNVHFAHKKLGLAHQTYDKALSLYRLAGDTRGQARTLNALGYLEKVSGNPEKAKTLYNQALDVNSTVTIEASLPKIILEGLSPMLLRGEYENHRSLYEDEKGSQAKRDTERALQ